jgi:tetratricopeptide (TPR) repeat protein
MRAVAATMLLLAMAACVPPGERAHTEAQWLACQGNEFAADRAGACSAVIGDAAAPTDRRTAALIQRGVLRAEYAQHGRAVADFGRALRLDPQNVDAMVERASVHVSRGAYDAALRDLDAALVLSPGNARALEERDLALGARIDAYATQIAQLSQALLRTPLDVELLNNRCWVRATAGRDLELALADCNAALLQRPDYGAALDSRGLVHLKRGAFAEALADYEAALVAEPGRGHYLYGRGLARRGLGLAAEADADLAAGERAEPGVARLYSSYGA